MDESTINSLKKYWPWAVGIVGFIFLYPRLAGGGSGDSGAVISNPMYDPNVLASQNALNAQAIQANAAVQGAQIEANAMVGMAEYTAIGQGFQALANINNANVMGNVASYQAYKDISVAGVTNAADVAEQGLVSGGASTVAFANTVAQLGIGSANAITGVANANAQASAALYRMVGGSLQTAITGGMF